MAEVADLPGCEGTFVGTELEFRVSEMLEDLAETVEVLLPGSYEDDDVVQVEEAGFPVETGEDTVHESGEGSGSVAEAKGNLVKLKQLAAAGAEGRLLVVLFLDRDLPISTLEIRVENQRTPCSVSRRSSMRGMGCASFTVASLSCLKSTLNRRLPSFFFTMTTSEAQGLLEGRMTPGAVGRTDDAVG